ncbi:peroxiredoxin [Brevirhabdus pacifica]|uniref:thioredoxin-dependent peroxiredoxin n=1 Tax=Brevirhabdus pacifica TaxID=1267768 RepID=A0A1U7DL49_9RHOB|nr:peroxiredoxin [Brevirhabdus pacifica]APX90702.1 peroxiredoxin [Brevirhabdus pacifica]OWU78321.1 alkyl hydroperoxide reductase [Loktanella sp. 22II-4b]PJJ85142.1 peroxiredoxin Q/BCP [Brevirhabdus pacifica]
MPETGQTAPDFALPQVGPEQTGDNAETLRLSDLRPAPVVLYFYPRDDTPGCTREAREFSEMLPKFAALGARVVGISRDTPAKHERFRDKHDLSVTLLSDEDGAVCEAYGVWVEKNMYGRRSMGIERATFLIDGEGIVRRVWRKVKVAGHAEEVLDAVAAL